VTRTESGSYVILMLLLVVRNSISRQYSTFKKLSPLTYYTAYSTYRITTPYIMHTASLQNSTVLIEKQFDILAPPWCLIDRAEKTAWSVCLGAPWCTTK